VPTVAETVPGFAATGWFALVAPPGTSAAIVKQFSEDLEAVRSEEQVKDRLGLLSVLTRRMSPAELASFVQAEQNLWRPVIKRIGNDAR
jgi:tripartite-type tricarboxylate transporter receptor subunit TctC